MDKNVKRRGKTVLCILLCVSLLFVRSFAADGGTVRDRLKRYLISAETTDFDFTVTDAADGDIDWAVFTLSRCGVRAYPQYAAYIGEVVANCFDSLTLGELARISLAAEAYGLDAENIGGHDLTAALTQADYSVQTVLGCLIYPLLALNFKGGPVPEETEDAILSALLAAQREDGGFPFSTEDAGWGVSSDTDTTSMALQALARYCPENDEIGQAVDRALDYVKAQQLESGAFGYAAYGTASGESTAQAILALYALGIDPYSPEFTKPNGSPFTALSEFIDKESGGGFYSYTDAESGETVKAVNTMTSCQLLLAYNSLERFENHKAGVYGYDEPFAEPKTSPEDGGRAGSDTHITKTGTGQLLLFFAAALAVLGALALLFGRRKNES